MRHHAIVRTRASANARFGESERGWLRWFFLAERSVCEIRATANDRDDASSREGARAIRTGPSTPDPCFVFTRRVGGVCVVMLPRVRSISPRGRERRRERANDGETRSGRTSSHETHSRLVTPESRVRSSPESSVPSRAHAVALRVQPVPRAETDGRRDGSGRRGDRGGGVPPSEAGRGRRARPARVRSRPVPGRAREGRVFVALFPRRDAACERVGGQDGAHLARRRRHVPGDACGARKGVLRVRVVQMRAVRRQRLGRQERPSVVRRPARVSRAGKRRRRRRERERDPASRRRDGHGGRTP